MSASRLLFCVGHTPVASFSYIIESLNINASLGE